MDELVERAKRDLARAGLVVMTPERLALLERAVTLLRWTWERIPDDMDLVGWRRVADGAFFYEERALDEADALSHASWRLLSELDAAHGDEPPFDLIQVDRPQPEVALEMEIDAVFVAGEDTP